ncbi:hypothetical protein HK414_10295 [Ramlibacter terrae]|uniref:Uncharacterized protein n=1 Tax=Ramlibacter terrae TaxID=2732511 RepID=A0ABX6P1Z8_9BURK|nr:hypothetical protein HK414_10295 [Ramlibacter terrae]
MTSPAASAHLNLPHVWRGRELAQAQERTVPTGHAPLDAELPGGGWPLGCWSKCCSSSRTSSRGN